MVWNLWFWIFKIQDSSTPNLLQICLFHWFPTWSSPAHQNVYARKSSGNRHLLSWESKGPLPWATFFSGYIAGLIKKGSSCFFLDSLRTVLVGPETFEYPPTPNILFWYCDHFQGGYYLSQDVQDELLQRGIGSMFFLIRDKERHQTSIKLPGSQKLEPPYWYCWWFRNPARKTSWCSKYPSIHRVFIRPKWLFGISSSIQVFKYFVHPWKKISKTWLCAYFSGGLVQPATRYLGIS